MSAMEELEKARALPGGPLAEEYDATIAELEAENERLRRVLRTAAADCWREQMDALDSDQPVDHIIDATIAKWERDAEVKP